MKYFISLICLVVISSCSKDELAGLSVQESYILPGDSLFPEGIAYDETSGSFFTGSVFNGDILKVDIGSGATTIFAKGALQNRNAATGMKLDSRRRLWICGGADNKIHVLDMNGQVLNTWNTQSMFGSGFINDVVIDDSYAYFTDSRVRKIYRSSVTSSTPGTPEEWLSFTDSDIPYAATGTNANGIVNTPGNEYLLIVVSSSGKLYRINKSTKLISEVTLDQPVISGDGLYLDGYKLYVSRNVANLIYPVVLNSSFTQGTVGFGFGSNLNFNTTITKVGKYLLAVNGQLNKRATSNPQLPFTVQRVDIP